MADPHPAVGAGVVLICECRPPSINNSTGKGKDRFGKALEASYQAAQPPRLDGLLYGIVCWFVLGYRAKTDPDADNISKVIWDMLIDRQPGDQAERVRLGAFADDKQVRLRIAGVFDLRADDAGTPAFSELELTGVPPEVVQRLEDMVSGAAKFRHLTYIRFGRLRASGYNLALSEGAS